jgi:hypothetical protein
MNDEKDDFMDLLSIVDKSVEDDDDDVFELDTLENLTQEEIEKRVQLELLKSIGFNNQVIKEVRDTIRCGADAEFVDAFAKVSKANADAIKILSELSLQKERIEAQKEIKRMDLEGKKELLEQKSSLELGNKSSTSTNTFILNMSREEIFDRVLGKEKEDAKPKKAVTDIIVEEIIED